MEEMEVLSIAKELEKKPHLLAFMAAALSLPVKSIKKVIKQMEADA